MIAVSTISTYDECRRDCLSSTPRYPAPAHPVRRALMHVLSMFGLGVGGVAAMDDDEALGIGAYDCVVDGNDRKIGAAA